MFVHYFTEVGCPAEEAVTALEMLRTRLGSWADGAYRDGEHLSIRLSEGKPLAKVVLFELGDPADVRGVRSYPITWRAIGATGLFPRLEGELLIADMGNRAILTLRGNYDPPLGAVGRLVDRTLLGRVADATVKSWVDKVAAALVLAASAGNDDLDDGALTGIGGDGDVAAEPAGAGPEVG
jgi:hypothetical protein